MARNRKVTPCDIGNHVMFSTLGGDELCALGCGHRVEGNAPILKDDGKRDWKADFHENVAACAGMGRPFTSEHIIAIVGPPTVRMSVNAMMESASAEGIIMKTGNVHTKDGTEFVEWIGR